MLRREHGRRLRGDWGGPPTNNLRWERPMHPSPKIWRTTVIECEAKYEQSKVDLQHEFVWSTVSKDRQIYSGCLKKVIRNFSALNRYIFPKKVHSEIWSEKFISSPKLCAKSPPMDVSVLKWLGTGKPMQLIQRC